MITHIRTENFNGADRSVTLDKEKVILVGPNGAGKTSLVQALQLAVTGYIPGEARDDRTVFLRHATDVGQAMMVEAQVNHNVLARIWTPQPDGSIATVVMIDKKRMSARAGAGALSMVLAGQVCFDVPAFLALSAEKQLSYLLEISGAASADLEKLGDLIEQGKRYLSEATSRRDAATSAAARLIAESGGLDRPTGTKAAVDEQIAAMRRERDTALKMLTTAETAERTRADLTAQLTALKAMPPDVFDMVESMRTRTGLKLRIEEIEAKIATAAGAGGDEAKKVRTEEIKAEGIKRIIDTVDMLLCEGCKGKVRETLKDLEGRISHARTMAKKTGDENSLLATQLSTLRTSLGTMERRLRDHADETQVKRNKLQHIETALAVMPAAADPGEWRAAIQRYDADLVALRAKADALAKADAYKGQIDVLAAERDAAEKDLPLIKATTAAYVLQRGKLLEGLVGPLTQVMTSVSGRGVEIVVDESGKKLDMRMSKVPHTSLSGGERVMFYAALSAGILAMSEATLRIIAVEAAEADWVVFGRLLHEFESLPATVFAMTCHPNDDLAGTGWQMVRLDGPDV